MNMILIKSCFVEMFITYLFKLESVYSSKILHHPITCYRIYIFKISSLNYMFYMFLTYMPIFIPIEFNLPFDL